MPTLDLFTPRPAHLADASHDVRAPGGYEWWYFDAEDPATDTQIVAIFLHGFVFHPGYLRAFYRYQNSPTRYAPPVPSDYVCAYFIVYRAGKILHQFMTQYPATEYAASRDRPEVRIGPNTFSVGSSDARSPFHLSLSGTPWKLTGRGPKTLAGQELSARLNFTPRFAQPADERRFFSRAMTGADHHWVVANPLCDVTGTISLAGLTDNQTIEFTGQGYHDHNYGTGPIGPGLKRWVWGRAFFENDGSGRVVTFHFARPRDTTLPDELHLTEADTHARTDHAPDPASVLVDWSGRSKLLLAYPRTLVLGDVMNLSNPRVIDDQPFYLRLVYDAVSRGKPGRAFCEVAYPHRLRWPVLGRMIEMSFDKR